jgi:hypothetical protein
MILLIFYSNHFREPSDLYDWFKGWEDLKPALVDQVLPTQRILMLGCGNSSYCASSSLLLLLPLVLTQQLHSNQPTNPPTHQS